MIKLIKKLFTSEPKPSLEEVYLSRATSLQDLERRQQEIERGNAPWHKQGSYYI